MDAPHADCHGTGPPKPLRTLQRPVLPSAWVACAHGSVRAPHRWPLLSTRGTVRTGRELRVWRRKSTTRFSAPPSSTWLCGMHVTGRSGAAPGRLVEAPQNARPASTALWMAQLCVICIIAAAWGYLSTNRSAWRCPGGSYFISHHNGSTCQRMLCGREAAALHHHALRQLIG